MADIEHSTLAGSELHEPKGIASATSEEVYVADGAASGAWKTIYTQGFEDYNDGGASQALTNGVYVDLANDGTGSFTQATYRLPGYNAIWDTVSNQFDWSGAGLVLGDTVDIRFDFTATTTGANHIIAARMDMAHGHASEYQLPFFTRVIKSASSTRFTVFHSLYMGDTPTLNNPAKVAMTTDSAGNSVVVNGWYIRVTPRNPVFV